MAKTADEFVRAHNGKAIDDDGAYGVQCVDGFRVFCKWALGKVWNTGGTGTADGYWYNRNRYALYFDFITNKQFRDGDFVIWAKGSKSHPSSHIAMYYHGKEFGQNQGGNRGFCLKDTTFSDALGALRWKGFHNTAPAAKPTTPTTRKKTNEQIANEVLAGKWGNDPQRSQKLRAAGYDPATIQKIVNARYGIGTKPASKPATPAPAPIKVGDRVKVLNPINYDTGRKFGLYHSVYTVMELRGKRAVIGVSGVVTAAINTANIRKA